MTTFYYDMQSPPPLFADMDYALVGDIAAEVNGLIDQETSRRNAPLGRAVERQLAMARTMDVIMRRGAARASNGEPMWSEAEENRLRDAVVDKLFGLGRIQQVLLDPEVEDIYIAGTRSVHVRMSDGSIIERPPIADTNEELLDQLRVIATHGTSTERQMSSNRPLMDMRLPDGQRAAAMWDVTPEPHVTIRCHRYVVITLDELVEMGMLSWAMARFLEAAVRAGRTILVIGPQGAGKTTLLRALAQCLGRYERFATLETEQELALHMIEEPYQDEQGREGIRLRFPLLVPMEGRPGTGEVGSDGRPAGEISVADMVPASLRHSLKRLLVGEMRADEIVPTLMAMSRGYRGSMSSFHANSARKTFNSLRSAVTFYSRNVSAEAAMGLVTDALDLIVCVDRETTAEGTVRWVEEILEVHDHMAADGMPSSTPIFAPDKDVSEFDPRGYFAHLPEEPTWARRAGLDLSLLTREGSQWVRPFPKRLLA